MRFFFRFKRSHLSSKKFTRAWRAAFSESGAFDSLLLLLTERLIMSVYVMTILPLLNMSFTEKGSFILKQLFNNFQSLNVRGKLRMPIWLMFGVIQLVSMIILICILSSIALMF